VNSLLKYIATVGLAGFSPVAPGTAGTLVALIIVALLNLPPVLYVFMTLAVTGVGIIAAERVEEILQKKDPGCIVIDEVAGYFVAVAFLPHTMGYLIAAFFLFRFFDIVKPPPANMLQRLKGGVGVMADDIVAGLYTNLLLQVWKHFVQCS
jgi:phosphatidylglycerophosphatase A